MQGFCLLQKNLELQNRSRLFQFQGLGFRVEGLGFGVYGLGFRVWFRAQDLGFRV